MADSITKKRENFYKSLEHIDFGHVYMSDDYLERVGGIKPVNPIIFKANLDILNSAIEMWIRQGKNYEIKGNGEVEIKDKGESIAYLKEILKYTKLILKEYHEKSKWENGIISKSVEENIRSLAKSCEHAGNSKFDLLTFGAVLDYAKTKKKFREFSDDLNKVADKVVIAGRIAGAKIRNGSFKKNYTY